MNPIVKSILEAITFNLFIVAAVTASVIAAHWSTVLWFLGLAK